MKKLMRNGLSEAEARTKIENDAEEKKQQSKQLFSKSRSKRHSGTNKNSFKNGEHHNGYRRSNSSSPRKHSHAHHFSDAGKNVAWHQPQYSNPSHEQMNFASSPFDADIVQVHRQYTQPPTTHPLSARPPPLSQPRTQQRPTDPYSRNGGQRQQNQRTQIQYNRNQYVRNNGEYHHEQYHRQSNNVQHGYHQPPRNFGNESSFKSSVTRDTPHEQRSNRASFEAQAALTTTSSSTQANSSIEPNAHTHLNKDVHFNNTLQDASLLYEDPRLQFYSQPQQHFQSGQRPSFPTPGTWYSNRQVGKGIHAVKT